MALVLILSGQQDDGSLYPDYDGFTVYEGTPVFITLGNFCRHDECQRRMTFPPVADDAETAFNTAVTLDPRRMTSRMAEPGLS
jgi:mannan endo-1,4-beta-mannosidase